MKIVVASDSMKGTLSSADIIGIFQKNAPKGVEICGSPIADGGEGTLDAVLSVPEFKEKNLLAANPLGKKIPCRYALSDDGKAFVEMAEASGLTKVSDEERNLLRSSTFGTGEIIADAVKEGAKEIYVAVGGSATDDGGMGALKVLGIKFFDENSYELSGTAEELNKVRFVDLKNKVGRDVKFTVLADVDNPLLGELGATYFYGKQKGGSPSDLEYLEKGMKNYADVTERVTGVRLHEMPHTGAAGGLSGGLMAYMGAEAKSGIESVLELTDFDDRIKDADFIVTGEGMIDDQSSHGKAISGVCAHAKKFGVPVVAMVGASKISKEVAKTMGISKIYTLLSDSVDAEDSMKNAPFHAERVSKKILDEILRGEV